MLLLFFGLVALCAVFFAMGFSLGRNSVLKTPLAEVSSALPISSTGPRPSAVKTAPEETAATTPAPANQDASPVPSQTASAGTETASQTPAASSAPAPVTNGYYVQVAAVSKQEDADALVDALKRKQYPAFAASTASDKLFHVQIGPYAEIKDAEAMRIKLVTDGYNPILKK